MHLRTPYPGTALCSCLDFALSEDASCPHMQALDAFIATDPGRAASGGQPHRDAARRAPSSAVAARPRMPDGLERAGRRVAGRAGGRDGRSRRAAIAARGARGRPRPVGRRIGVDPPGGCARCPVARAAAGEPAAAGPGQPCAAGAAAAAAVAMGRRAVRGLCRALHPGRLRAAAARAAGAGRSDLVAPALWPAARAGADGVRGAGPLAPRTARRRLGLQPDGDRQPGD